MDFEIAGSLRRASAVDIPRNTDQRARLRRTHGRRAWRKQSALATVRLRDGSVHKAVVHWYTAEGIGRREMKLKFPLVD
jgi:hypothetical protein